MPGAGLYPIHTDRLTFARDGRWYADGEPVIHPRLAVFFSRHLRRKAAGGYEIWVDERFHADVEIEDTPFVVVGIDCRADGVIELELNDGTREELDENGLEVGDDDAFYSPIKNASERARWLRAAHNQLAPHVVERNDGFEVSCAERRYPIRRG